MKLLKEQLNELHDMIKAYGLSHSNFTFCEIDNDGFKISYIKTNYFVQIEHIWDTYFFTYSPAKDKYIEKESNRYYYSWVSFRQIIHAWLGCLRKELETPDKWEEYYKLSESFSIEGNNWDEQYFTSEEKVIVKEKLCLLKEDISKLDLLEEQVEKLNESIDYLSRKVEDTTKLDWKNIVVGTLFSKFFDLAIGSEVAKQIWGMVTQLFNNISLLK